MREKKRNATKKKCQLYKHTHTHTAETGVSVLAGWMGVFQAKAPTVNRCKAKHFLNDILCVRGDAGECVSRALINKIDLGSERAQTDQTRGVLPPLAESSVHVTRAWQRVTWRNLCMHALWVVCVGSDSSHSEDILEYVHLTFYRLSTYLCYLSKVIYKCICELLKGWCYILPLDSGPRVHSFSFGFCHEGHLWTH